jgi:hypothetical protein
LKIPEPTVRKILRKRQQLYPYQLQLVQNTPIIYTHPVQSKYDKTNFSKNLKDIKTVYRIVLPVTCSSCNLRDRISAVSLSTSALCSSSLCCNNWMYELTDCGCCCGSCCSCDWDCPTEEPVPGTYTLMLTGGRHTHINVNL